MAGDIGRHCPHLGLAADRDSTLMFADAAHRCYAGRRGQPIDLKHQERFCMGRHFEACPHYVRPPEAPRAAPHAVAATTPAMTERELLGEPTQEFSLLRVVLWALVGLAMVSVGIRYGPTLLASLPSPTPVAVALKPTVTPTATDTPPAATATPLKLMQPTTTPTPPPGGASLALSPAAEAVGWVVSSEERGNHFGDSHIYSGVYDGNVYHGAIQFDLSVIPRGSPIYAASLQLTGLNKRRLGEQGMWEVRILTDTFDYVWPSVNYQDVHNAPVLQSLSPVLGSQELEPRRINAFRFTGTQLGLLEERVLKEGRLSLRVDGPYSGLNNLFSWDSGYGPETQGLKPELFLVVGQPPESPPPREYVVVTNTPTPENVLTAAAVAARLTADVTTTGTATPTPRNMVTATPEDWIVVTNSPVPENAATAESLNALATALALTTGTATATPYNLVTATPSPTFVIITSVPTPENAVTAEARAIATATAAYLRGTATPLPPNWVTPLVVTTTPVPENQATAVALVALATADFLVMGPPTPTPPNLITATPTPTYVLITSVPTPENALTAQAWAAATATVEYLHGTATPLPPNWVTPIVVTATPEPENDATATAIAAFATARYLSFGEPSPTPPNMVTATPTPLIDLVAVTNPTPTPMPSMTPTPDPKMVPDWLVGRIGFISDREGGQPAYYAMDADGSNVQRLSGPELYNAALLRDTLDPTGQFQAFVVHTQGGPDTDTQINLRRLSDGYEWYVAGGTKGADYAPAYCEADPRYVAYTSEQSGGGDIYVVDLSSGGGPGSELRTTRLTQNEWEWDKHPSWSADCRQIVFFTNREGHDQIYVMDYQGMDYQGGNPRNLSNDPYNNWDPVWFKAPPVSQ